MLPKTLALIVPLSLLIIGCHAKDDCKERIQATCEETSHNQCYFDPERGCFKHFETNCDMEIAACKYEQVYEQWSEKFCTSVQFLCNEEVDDYNWPPEDFYDQIRHIRDNATNQFEAMLGLRG